LLYEEFCNLNAIEIKPDIYWVGAIDWGVRDFHGYVTQHGTTYNNYLILDEHITLIDTVKYDFSQVTIDNIKALIDPSKIVNLVINHIEPDHVSSIDRVMALIPDATIYITEKGKKGLDRHYDTSTWNFRIVKTGDTLNTGNHTLLFLETPMLHWPDSMMTYVKEAKLLISQDAFGQHIATSARFDDEFIECASHAELMDSVVDYYANILMPFGQLIKTKIAEIKKLGLDIDMIAPDHGIIWKREPGNILQRYLDMANGKTSLSISIIYDTMWHSTEHMTLPIMKGIKDEGINCKVIKLRVTPNSVAIKEFWKSRGCLIGSPTLNNLLFPSVAGFLTHLRGLRPKNRVIGAFGSYGWGGGAIKEAYEIFQKMGLEIFEPGPQVFYKPSLEDDKKCYDFGKEFAKEVKKYHTKFENI
jgi:flavorubredoxin